jgi:hypothetical protein
MKEAGGASIKQGLLAFCIASEQASRRIVKRPYSFIRNKMREITVMWPVRKKPHFVHKAFSCSLNQATTRKQIRTRVES